MLASFIYVPMNHDNQKNHLKAYGIVYFGLKNGLKSKWLLNYDGGAFLIEHNPILVKECKIRGVSYQVISDTKAQLILEEISSPSKNMEAVALEKAPKIAVYSPKNKMPWDDAVTMVLTYAEIPFDVVYDKEVLNDELLLYEWLHLHHEDFTGQYGRFYGAFRAAPWYVKQKKEAEALAAKLGYSKVAKEKGAVAKKIRDYVIGGGFMFAMCSATDSFDIALAADGIDIVEGMFDGDASEPNYQSKIDFDKTFAFKDFDLIRDPTVYEFSTIDMTRKRRIKKEVDYFSLKEFSAKWDQVPTMLTQNHTRLVKAFMGQTTSFDRNTVKPAILVLGENKTNGEARYIHGTKGKGLFTFYGGHDPEDYQHRVGDPKTELDLHPMSPGYRLILNNVLFPAAKKKKQKT
ncbi:asparagine synthetase B [Tenacibaculum maritimum]|uniref:Asparagine synthetase B n=2 Tax=Tenacibaculum maritimum TaxID=107401 RepID=A0A2H1EA61_9FLAO|nr:asparagine synthetase B [Tenacibaculum maritimum]MCD9561612.1 asparagine synthetase B [Tenacibaculum maritimum]MCD9565367.1 asparagine synthetase B [Tenacibaculum maritimum]MCD9579293.1 asparagine synthetase B [Tenacibaculum maritimum]MCD9584345.1 asparagine synthetase B [Tenacibaculum maritimum]MCD9597181.1 asparagine synthetase B [Tenacibaculum maritimum]